jgi:hypothetical protein
VEIAIRVKRLDHLLSQPRLAPKEPAPKSSAE